MKQLCSFPHKNSIRLVFLDFDGVFTDNKVHLDESGQEYVTCCRYDGFGLSSLIKKDILPIVLTTETKPLARYRCSKLKIMCHDCVEDKYSLALQLLKSMQLSLNQAAFLGNDINDLKLLESVAFPIVTPDSNISVQKDRFYVTSYSGGNGCVREVCDYLCS